MSVRDADALTWKNALVETEYQDLQDALEPPKHPETTSGPSRSLIQDDVIFETVRLLLARVRESCPSRLGKGRSHADHQTPATRRGQNRNQTVECERPARPAVLGHPVKLSQDDDLDHDRQDRCQAG